MLAAGTPIGKYVVRRKIAEGGMAEIYLCSSRGPEGFEKDVAIKRIRSYLAGDQSFVQMFIAEARLASRLNHANLVQIFDFDKHEDTYYLAMELVRGHSLWDVRKRSKELMQPMPPTLVAHIGAEVARGLWYAHRLADGKGKPLNLVHRDVTPHNVLLSFDGAVKLTDFGVAKHSASSTAAGVLKGKFAYMSPEQSRGEPLDARTDLFALGIVLWEMLTGGRLFDGDSDVAVLRAVQSSVIAPPARLNPDVPEALSAVVMKALEREAAQRYQNAQEMERALAGFVLAHAKSVDDTDLAGYLRSLYADELAQEAPEGTRSGPSPSEGAPEPRREPTALLRKDAGGALEPTPASPDEDVHASTHVVDRGSPRTQVRSGPTTVPDPAPQPPAAGGAEAQPAAAPPSPPKVIADLSALAPGPRPPSGASGPRPAPLPPPTLTIPAMRRTPRPSVGMRRAAIAAVMLAVGIGAAAVTVAVTRRPEAPAAASSQPSADAPPPTEAAAPSPVPPAPELASAPAPAGSPAGPSDSPAPAAERPASPPEAPAAPAKATPMAAAERSAPPGQEDAELGTLVVRVRPYASVTIDGKKHKDAQGTASFKLAPGPHQVRLDHPRGHHSEQVVIQAGKESVVKHSFLGR